VPRFKLRVPPVPLSSPEARHALAAWLAGIGYTADTAYGPLLVVSELVANGVIHDGGDDIIIDAAATDRNLCIEVETAPAPAGQTAYARQGLDPSETGRGMSIVAACCDEVVVYDDRAGRRHVTCNMVLEG